MRIFGYILGLSILVGALFMGHYFRLYNPNGHFLFDSYQNAHENKTVSFCLSDIECGLIYTSGEIILDPKYTDVRMVHSEVATVQNDSLYYLYNLKTKTFSKEGFNVVRSYVNGLAVINQGGYYGAIDINGNVVIHPKYLDIGEFSEGLAAVWMPRKGYGYIDSTNTVIIDGKFTKAGDFINGVAIVASDFADDYGKNEGELYGLIDRQGNYILERKYHNISRINSRGFRAEHNGEGAQIKYYNNKGEEGRLSTYPSGQETIITHEGHFIIEKAERLIALLGYEMINAPHESIYIARRKGKYGALNMEGETIVPFDYDSLTNFSENFSVYTKGTERGIITSKNEVIFEAPIITEISSFKDGLALVTYADRRRHINVQGVFIDGVSEKISDVIKEHMASQLEKQNFYALTLINRYKEALDTLTRFQVRENISVDDLAKIAQDVKILKSQFIHDWLFRTSAIHASKAPEFQQKLFDIVDTYGVDALISGMRSNPSYVREIGGGEAALKAGVCFLSRVEEKYQMIASRLKESSYLATGEREHDVENYDLQLQRIIFDFDGGQNFENAVPKAWPEVTPIISTECQKGESSLSFSREFEHLLLNVAAANALIESGRAEAAAIDEFMTNGAHYNLHMLSEQKKDSNSQYRDTIMCFDAASNTRSKILHCLSDFMIPKRVYLSK